MIRGMHGMLYSSDADATRDFMRDVMKLPYTDVGGGWLIFDLPMADLGSHPADAGQTGAHDVSFFCDDIERTVADLKKRGATFKGDPADHGYGWVTYLEIPGGIVVQLYEPKYQKGAAKPAAKKSAAKKKAKPAAKKAAKPAASKRKASPKAKRNARKKR